ncbi:MAG: DNA polymerase III subunit delta [Gammaproteobacteria bacterium HGW-Gammaproteobacteria-7]|nr:MAG: DNA polymerase III subunit delta [Gammaproteobacteria bacterium HGW-Gammaproteobacteria-7]
MELSPKKLTEALAREPMRPVYLVAGAEQLTVLETADAIRAQARAQGYDERLVHEAGKDFDWNVLAADFGALSLFSQRRVFDVRLPTGRPGREGGEFLRAYCTNPPPDTVLLITCAEWSKAHAGKWSEAIAKAGHMAVCWPVKPDSLPAWLRERLQRVDLTLDADALALLVERVEGNLLAADQEIRKLALQLEPGTRLDGPGLAALIADSARYDVFQLLDAALAGDARRAVRVLAGLRAEGVQVPQLMGWLGGQLLVLAKLAAAAQGGEDISDAMRRQGIWQARQVQFRAALKRHPGNRWDRFVTECARIDQASKGRFDADPWLLLERVLVAVAEPQATRKLLAA